MRQWGYVHDIGSRGRLEDRWSRGLIVGKWGRDEEPFPGVSVIQSESTISCTIPLFSRGRNMSRANNDLRGVGACGLLSMWKFEDKSAAKDTVGEEFLTGGGIEK